MRGGKEKRKTEAVAEERQQVQQSQRRSSSDVVSIITLSLTAAAEAAAATPVKWVGVDLGGWQGQRQWTTLALTLPSSFPSPTHRTALPPFHSLSFSLALSQQSARGTLANQFPLRWPFSVLVSTSQAPRVSRIPNGAAPSAPPPSTPARRRRWL